MRSMAGEMTICGAGSINWNRWGAYSQGLAAIWRLSPLAPQRYEECSPCGSGGPRFLPAISRCAARFESRWNLCLSFARSRAVASRWSKGLSDLTDIVVVVERDRRLKGRTS